MIDPTVTDGPRPETPPVPPPPPPFPAHGPPRRPARRSRLWLIVGSVILVPVMVWGILSLVLLLAHETETVTEVVAARDIALVEVRNPTGRVEVVGADVDEVTIRAEVSHGLRRTGYGHRVEGERLEIWGTCPVIGSSWCEVKYLIEVPRDVTVEVRSADRAVLRSLRGTVEARISNGSVAAVGLSGPTKLRSTNGSVRVEDHRGDELVATSSNGEVSVAVDTPPTQLEARSTNGDVLVELPADETIRYRVTLETTNGDRTNEVVTDPNSDREVMVDSTNGDVTVRYR